MQEIEKIYQKKTDVEHVLLRPQVYLGSMEKEQENLWILKESKITQTKMDFIPALLKIFDEILVNAADNKEHNMTKIKVTIEKDHITIYNDGKSIPVVIHKEFGIYVAELIFGNMFSSSHYDDEKERTVGGMNGLGSKLTNIFSSKFIVETQDSINKKSFKQTFTNNMTVKSTPIVKDCDKSDYTQITFYIDFKRFGIEELDENTMNLFKRRVYDIAGTFNDTINIYLNKEKIKVKSFKQYVELFQDLEKPIEKLLDKPLECKINNRWHVILCPSSEYRQVSFVNSIWTRKGGTHVKAIKDQIEKAICEIVNKKDKSLNVKPAQVKNHLSLFVNSTIVNPSFDTQSKDTLVTKPNNFGSEYTLTPEFLKQLAKSSIIEQVVQSCKIKSEHDLLKDLKKCDGKKKSRIAIPKLDDANDAGTKLGHQCTLILTEGDSAKALAVAGISVVGRDKYGVFPLKGKLLNVRDASSKSIMENVEITSLKQILGLQHGKKYENTKSLRYGHVMIMADQDHDGSHIKGLIINFFQKFWPELFKMPGFLQEFITPIVKVTKKNQCISFYTIPEYKVWQDLQESGWTAKYYKGLGSSTAKEGKEYFSQLNKHVINFKYDTSIKPCPELSDTIPDYETWPDEKLMDMAFGKKWLQTSTKRKWNVSEADIRKDWISKITKTTFVDQASATKYGLSYNDFLNKELVLFSQASNERAIPHIMDGLKPGQRKILFTCFKRNLKKELKVAQLAGSVSEKSAYHHGEASLNGTIVNLAQNHVGSNNINYLMPNGQFGTRSQGGKDSASPRYIFTNLSKITRYIFMTEDDAICGNLNDDGLLVEPEYYVPIIPMTLVNGSAGIGTGWASNIPNYNPRDVIKLLQAKLKSEDYDVTLKPWYNGFKGLIEYKSDKILVHGIISKVKNDDLSFMITELPIGWWTSDYKLFLESLLDQGILTSFKEYHTTTDVGFLVTFDSKETVAKLYQEGFHFTLKLTSSLHTSNMVLYDAQGHIKNYTTPEEILNDFYVVRLAKYKERKCYLEAKLQEECKRLYNQVRFISEVNQDVLDIRNKEKCAIVKQLVSRGYDSLITKSKPKKDDDQDETKEDSNYDSNYEYLLTMRIQRMTKEIAEKYEAQYNAKQKELDLLKAMTIQDLWLKDLDVLLEQLDLHFNLYFEDETKSKSQIKMPSIGEAIPIFYQVEGFKSSIIKSKIKMEQDAKKAKLEDVKESDNSVKSEIKMEPKKRKSDSKKMKLEKKIKLEPKDS